jgi:hypothetical protein
MTGPSSAWRLVGDDVYTCVAPAGYEKDSSVTAAIREFDPGVIPIWRIQIWAAPGQDRPVPFVHHGIGRYYPFPRHLRRPFACPVPATWCGPVPNFLDTILEDLDAGEYQRGGPGGYIPWTWDVYYWARRNFDRVTVEAFDKMIERKRERQEKLREAWAAEVEYRKKQIEPWILRKLAGVSDSDWEQYQAMMHEREVRRRMGQKPGPVRPPKVFADLGRSPRSSEIYGRVAPSRELE